MDQAVMGVAQQDEVVEVGGSTICPVDQMVGLDPPLPLAPGEAAPQVTMAEQSRELAGDGPAPPADPHRASSGFQDPLDPPVAGQPADRVGSQAGSTLGLGKPRTPGRFLSGEDLGPGVDHQSGRRSVLSVPSSGQLHQSVGHPGLPG
jgi:hypothetical protein